jgi:hypothetical protein
MTRHSLSASVFLVLVVLLGSVHAGPASAGTVDCSDWPAPDPVGVPNLNDNRGAVEVATPTGRTLVTRESLGIGRGMPGDRFGAALTEIQSRVLPGADVCIELAVGAPGVDQSSGAVDLIYGMSDSGGFTAGREVRLPYAASGDEFGSSLSAGWGCCDAPVVVAAGSPGRDVGGVKDAGAIASIALDDKGHPGAPTLITQASKGVAGAPETGDRFGEVMGPIYSAEKSTRIAILAGVPHEDVWHARDAGMVEEVYLLATRFTPTPVVGSFGNWQAWTQSSPGIPGRPESDDRFGAALAFDIHTVGIGAPGEDVGSLRDAGSVTFMRAGYTEFFVSTFTPAGAITQNSPGVSGSVEAGDEFGASVVSYDGHWPNCGGFAIGSPGEGIGSAPEAGSVLTYIGNPDPIDIGCRSLWGLQGSTLPDRVESGDRFGTQLAVEPGDPSILKLSVPGEDLRGNKAIDAGVVDVLIPSDPDSGSVSQHTLVGGPVKGVRYAVLPSEFWLSG